MGESCTPFDPLVDTETRWNCLVQAAEAVVAPPSIRLWILKRAFWGMAAAGHVVAPPSIRLWILKRLEQTNSFNFVVGCTPFDPLVDTETVRLSTLKLYF